MKKIFLIFLLFFIPKITFWEEFIYPMYYWTKKCEITKNIVSEKHYAFISKSNEKNFYLIKNSNNSTYDLYKNNKLYKTWVENLLYELDDYAIYTIKNWEKIDIYKNDEKILTLDDFSLRDISYNQEIDRYYFYYNLWEKGYIYSNWKSYNYDEFENFTRFYSDNKKYYLDVYFNEKWFKIYKNSKIIIEKLWYSLDNLSISNNWESYSYVISNLKDDTKSVYNNLKEISLKNVEIIKYSPDWKDVYFITNNNNNYSFYKNEKFLWKYDSTDLYYWSNFKFLNNDNFYFILTNGDDYIYIENWKVLYDKNSDVQIKTIVKKPNGDELIVKRYKKLWIDKLFLNQKMILQWEKIDERYINDAKDTFSIFPNENNSNEYYTYVWNSDNSDLFVNWFIIPNMYDYLNLKNWLSEFNFLSKDYRLVSCKDITYSYPDLKYSRENLEKILVKIQNLSVNNQKILLKKLNNFYLKQKSEKNKELIKLFIDNTNYFLNQKY